MAGDGLDVCIVQVRGVLRGILSVTGEGRVRGRQEEEREECRPGMCDLDGETNSYEFFSLSFC